MKLYVTFLVRQHLDPRVDYWLPSRIPEEEGKDKVKREKGVEIEKRRGEKGWK